MDADGSLKASLERCGCSTPWVPRPCHLLPQRQTRGLQPAAARPGRAALVRDEAPCGRLRRGRGHVPVPRCRHEGATALCASRCPRLAGHPAGVTVFTCTGERNVHQCFQKKWHPSMLMFDPSPKTQQAEYLHQSCMHCNAYNT